DSVEGSGEGAVASLDSVEGSGEGAVASLKEAESLPQAASAAHMGLLNDPPEPFVNLFEAPLQQRGESTVDDVGVNPTDALLLLYLKPTDQGQDFPGVDVLKIAADAGMCMGERRIFHFPTEEHPQLLLLDLYKPGYLEVSDLMDKRFRGLVFVLCAPCAEDAKYLANPEQAFFDCMACINQIATLLKGTLSLKPNWAEPLDAERIDDLRHRYMKLLPSAK
ncbi:MAG: cell division protein ZipA C-terminal FtsZ-binding domain-containing protein, partial [Candidatus Eutrophobiaceae bacterium]